jgi:hypothetical protein
LRTPGLSVPVVFDVSLPSRLRKPCELLDILHPFVAFLRSTLDEAREQMQPVMAAAVPCGRSDEPPGVYVFATDRWRFEGVRHDISLQTIVTPLRDRTPLATVAGDKLVEAAMRHGETVEKARLSDFGALHEAFQACINELQDRYDDASAEFKQENKSRSEQARMIVTERAAQRIVQLTAQLESQRNSPDPRRQRVAPMTQGKIDKVIADREQRLARIAASATSKQGRRAVAGGVIVVED